MPLPPHGSSSGDFVALIVLVWNSDDCDSSESPPASVFLFGRVLGETLDGGVPGKEGGWETLTSSFAPISDLQLPLPRFWFLGVVPLVSNRWGFLDSKSNKSSAFTVMSVGFEIHSRLICAFSCSSISKGVCEGTSFCSETSLLLGSIEDPTIKPSFVSSSSLICSSKPFLLLFSDSSIRSSSVGLHIMVAPLPPHGSSSGDKGSTPFASGLGGST